MNWFSYAVLPLLIFVSWVIACVSGAIPTILLPTPQSVLEAFWLAVKDGSLVHNILASALRSLSGFFLAAFFGVSLGLLFAYNKTAHRMGYVAVEAIRVTPPLALIPLLILWLGIDEAPKIAIVFLSSFFPIYMNSLTAVKTIDPKLIEVGKLMNFSRWEEFRLLTLPASLPGILTGLRLGFGYSWRALVGAELIAASSGLGFLISESAEFAKTETVFVGIFTIVILGILADNLLSFLVKRATKHG